MNKILQKIKGMATLLMVVLLCSMLHFPLKMMFSKEVMGDGVNDEGWKVPYSVVRGTTVTFTVINTDSLVSFWMYLSVYTSHFIVTHARRTVLLPPARPGRLAFKHSPT